jgi:hypothetical protein
MVQVDIPFSFGVGALMATAVEQGLRSDRRPYFYYLGLAANLVLQALFVIWLPLYLLVNHFGFQTSHMWWHGDSLLDHPIFLPAFMVLYFLSCIGGYQAGVWLVERGRTGLARAVFYGGCAFFAGWMFLQPHRTLTLGTYQEWVDGRAVWIWTDTTFMTLLGVAFVAFVVALRIFLAGLRRRAAEPMLRVGLRT